MLRQYRSQLEKEADIYDRLKNLKAGWTTEEAEGYNEDELSDLGEKLDKSRHEIADEFLKLGGTQRELDKLLPI